MDTAPTASPGTRQFSTDWTGRALGDLYPVVRRVAKRYSRDSHHADDLTQECMVRIVRKLPKSDSGADLASWARTVAHNRCRTLHRREQAEEARHVSLEACGDVPDPVAQPDRDCESRLRADAVDAAINRLPERDAAAVRHVHLEGMTFPDAAGLMGMRAAAVRKAAARGIATLRQSADLVVWIEGGMRRPNRHGSGRSGDHPVLALEPDRVARQRLMDGLRLGETARLLDGVRFASGWREIDRLAHRLPGCPVVVDPECPAGDRRGVDALRRLREHNPDSPVIGYGRAASDWQSPGLVGDIGFFAVVSMGVNDDARTLSDTLIRAADCEETEALVRRVKACAAPQLHRFLDMALHESVLHRTVACVADRLGVGERSLGRRCRASGLPTPKRLMLLACAFHVERLARWSGHTRQAVGAALGIRRASDYGRIVGRVFGVTPSQLSERGGPDHVADVIVREVARNTRATSGAAIEA